MHFLCLKNPRKILALICLFSVLIPSFSVSAQSFLDVRNFQLSDISFNEKQSTTIPASRRLKIVSLLVEENLLKKNTLSSKIERYATDVQKAINGKVVLVPIPQNYSPKEIWEGNAHLYFSGINSDQKSQLVGTILIGDVPIPVVNKNGRLQPSVFPYTDFEKNNYRWDAAQERFVFESGGDEEPEIWHGVIKSDTNSNNALNDNVIREQELIGFFDRNHQFHSGNIEYAKKTFYADILLQKEGIPKPLKDSYYKWLDHIEDILYMRYTSALAQELFADKNIEEIIPLDYLPSDAQPDADMLNNGKVEMDFSGLPDIYSKGVIDSMIKRYFEFYEGYLSQTNSKIGNTGRWTPEKVDTTISLISKKDENAAKLLKSFNDEIETILYNEVDRIDVAKDITIPLGGTLVRKEHRVTGNISYEFKSTEHNDCSVAEKVTHKCDYINFPFYWNGSLISDPNFDNGECSLLRGSNFTGKGQIVEINRSLNLNNIETDKDATSCTQSGVSKCCGLNKQIAGQDLDEDGEDDYELDISKCEFADVANFPFYFDSDEEGDYAFFKDGDGNFVKSGNRYDTERIPLFDYSGTRYIPKSTHISTRIATGGCVDIMRQANESKIPAAAWAQVPTKSFDSLYNMVEPTPATIAAQFASAKTSPPKVLPIDNPRGFFMYNHAYTGYVRWYPNVFDLRKEFLNQEESLRKTNLKNKLSTVLSDKISEINSFTDVGDLKIANTFFDQLWTKFNKDEIIDAVVWLDKPLEEKNIDMLLGSLSGISQGREMLLQDDFNGYEFIQITAQKSDIQPNDGIQVDFERGREEPSSEFLNAQLKELSFDFEQKKSAENFYGLDFEKDVLGQNGDQNTTQSGNNGCDRKISKWGSSCLIPWLSELPNMFGTFTKIIPTFDKDGNLGTPTVASGHQNIPATDSIAVTPESLFISAADTTPREFKVSLYDIDKNLINADFETKVTITPTSSDFDKFFNLVSPKEQIVQGGKISFFLTPKTANVGGKFSLTFSTSGGKTTTVPISISAQKLQTYAEKTKLEAGDSKGTPIETKILNLDGTLSRKYDGQELKFSSSQGKFSTGNTVKIVDGVAATNFFPGTKAITTDITISDEQGKLPNETLSIEVIPTTPSQIIYENDITTLVDGADFVTLKAAIADKFENIIPEKSAEIFFITESVESDDLGNGQLKIKAISGEKQAEIKPDASSLEQKTPTKEIPVVVNPQLQSSTKIIKTKAGGEQLALSLKARTKDAKKIRGFFTGKIQQSDKAIGIFPTTFELRDGEAVINFSPGVKAGKSDITFLIDGFSSETVSLEVAPEAAKKISIFSDANVIDADDSANTEVSIKAFDIYGNLATDFDDSVYIKINPPETFSNTAEDELKNNGALTDTNKLKYLKDNSNPKDLSDFYPTYITTTPSIQKVQKSQNSDAFYAAEVTLSNGIGTFKIKPNGESHTLYILAEKDDLVPGTEEIEISKTLSRNDFDYLSPKSIFTLLTGFSGGDLANQNIGNRFLFSGQTQAVATMITEENLKKVLGYISPDGKKSGLTSALVFANKPTIDIFLQNNKELTLEVSFQKNPRIFSSNVSKEAGIYFQPSQNDIRLQSRQIFEKTTPLFGFHSKGGVYTTAPNINFVPVQDSFLQWQVKYQGKTIGLLSFVPEKEEFLKKSADFSPKLQIQENTESNIFALSEFSTRNLFSQNSEPAGIYYTRQNKHSLLSKLFTGTSTNDQKGLVFLDRESEEDQNKKLGFSTTSIEEAGKNKEVGWNENWKPATLFAANNIVGESVKIGASDNLILLGDPTVSLRQENPKGNLNISGDIGKAIWKSTNGVIDQIIAGDLNNDGRAEIFPRIGEELYALYHDSKEYDNFRDTGPILRFGDGVKTVASYTNDNKDLIYLIQLNKEGQLIFHKNIEGTLVRETKDINIGALIDIKVGEVNGDKYKDIVALDQNNTLYFIHGKAGNQFHKEPAELYNFSPKFTSINETHTIQSLSNKKDYFSNKTEKKSADFLISFSDTAKNSFDTEIIREINDRNYTNLTNNTAFDTTLVAKKSGKLKIGEKIPYKLTLTSKKQTQDVTLLIPKSTGLKFDTSSLKCQNCDQAHQVSESKSHVLISDISPSGKTITITWNSIAEEIPAIDFTLQDFAGNDGIDDVAVPWVSDDKERNFFKFISNSNPKTYPIQKSVTPKINTLESELLSQKIRGFFEILTAQAIGKEYISQSFIQNTRRYKTHNLVINEAFPDSAKSALQTGDADYEKISDDVLGSLSFATPSVETALQAMTCGGKCGLPIPSFVFTAPGQQSLYIPPIGIPGLPSPPIPVIGLPALQIVPMLPIVYPFTPSLPASVFRMFVIPTTSGAIGTSLCLGPPSGFSVPPLPIGNCFTFAIPLLEMVGACPASLLGLQNSPALQGLQGSFLAGAGGNTGSFSPPSVSKPTNQKLMSADIITEWVRLQFEEFSNFKFPNINFTLPNIKSPSGGSKDQPILKKLENSPLINVKKQTIPIPYPDFSQNQIDQLKTNWNNWKNQYSDWKKNFKPEVPRIKNTGMATIIAILKVKEKNKFLATAAKQTAASFETDERKDSLSPENKAKADASLQKNIAAIQSKILASSSDLSLLQKEAQEIEVPAIKSLAIQLLAEANAEKSELSKQDLKTAATTSNTPTPTKKPSENTQNNLEISRSEKTETKESPTIPLEKQKNTQKGETETQSLDTQEVESILEQEEASFLETIQSIFKEFLGANSFKDKKKSADFSEKLQTEINKKINPDLVIDQYEKNIHNFEANIATLEGYKKSTKALKQTPIDLKKLLKKTEESTSFVNNYFSQWIQTNKKNAAEWDKFRLDLGSTLAIFSSIPEIFSGMESFCTRCNVNRGSLLAWLLNMLLGAVKLPVIPMPKLSDVTIDMSRLGLGLDMTVPQIQLNPVELKAPPLPPLPTFDTQKIFESILIAAVLGLAEYDWQKQFESLGINISEEFLTLLLVALNFDADLLKLLEAAFENTFNQTIDALLSNIDIKNIPGVSDILGNIPTVPLLPPLPSINALGVNLQLPTLNLPTLPVILAPPILPNWLEKIQALIQIPKPFFQMLCFFLMGYLPVPEWKVASTVQEMTNRTLLLPLDFAFAAQVPMTPKSSPKPKSDSAGQAFSPAFDDLSKKIQTFQKKSECTVQQISAYSNGDKKITNCADITANTETTLGSSTVVYEVDFGTPQQVTLENRKSAPLVKNQIAQLEALIQHPQINEKNSSENLLAFTEKVWGESPENTNFVQRLSKKWLASTQTINLNDIPKSTPSGFDKQAYQDTQDEAIPYIPKMYFYDPVTDTAESIIDYPLAGKTYQYLATDLDEDNKQEILFSLDSELYLKRRYINPKKSADFLANSTFIRWDRQKFTEKYIPTQKLKDSIESIGANLSFQKETTQKQIPYFEWLISERPDIVFEYTKQSENRKSKHWERIGFLVRNEPRKYQIRTSTAQIKKIQGDPIITGSPMANVQLFEDRQACENNALAKPFYATKTILVANEDDTVFNVKTKPRNGEDQKSYWKTMRKGEETLVDFAEICLISGNLQEITTDDRVQFTPKAGDYFSSGMKLEMDNDDRAQIQLFDGRIIDISPNETYEIQYIKSEKDRAKKLQSLNIGNYYGVFQAFDTDQEPSFTRAKMLHDRQATDDKTPPQINLSEGTSITANIFESIQIDASSSFDDTEIKQITWSSNKEDLLLENQQALQITIPAQKNPQIFSLTLQIEDIAGNISKQDIQVEITIPNSEIIEVTKEEKQILGKITPPRKNIPLTLFRDRNNKKTSFSSIITDENGEFSVTLKEQGKVEIWQKNPRKKLAEVLPNGRPILFDETLTFSVFPAKKETPTRIVLKKDTLQTIAEIQLRLSQNTNIEPSSEKSADFLSKTKNIITKTTTPDYIWKKTETDVLKFKNTFALIDTKNNQTIGILAPNGNFHLNTNQSGTLSIKPEKNETAPIIFQIQKNKKTVGEFVLPLDPKLWIK